MLPLSNCNAMNIVIVGVASLAWFVVGVLAGRALPSTSGSKRKSGRRNSKGRDRKSTRPSRIKGNPELYMGNLSYDVTEDDLTGLLSDFGKVSSVRLITNSFNGKSKGYAFVQMANRASSDKVTKALNGKEYEGRKLVVNIAKNRNR